MLMAPYPQLHACMLTDGPLSPVACMLIAPLSPVACMLITLPSEQMRESVEARACMPIALPHFTC